MKGDATMSEKRIRYIVAVVCVLFACGGYTAASAFVAKTVEAVNAEEAVAADVVQAEGAESEEDKATEAKAEEKAAKVKVEDKTTEVEAEEEDAEKLAEPEPTAVVSDEETVASEEPEPAQPASSDDDSDCVNANVDGNWYPASNFMTSGRLYDSSGWSYTYYSEKVLPGGGLSIPGRHVGDEGYVMDGDGNLCIASDDLAYGTAVSVPFGSGTAVVYDCGSGSGNLDVYVSW